MSEAYICDYIRTPIGRYGGVLSSVRADDLGAIPLKALMERNGSVDWEVVDDVIFGSANQAGKTTATLRVCHCFWPDCRWGVRNDDQPSLRFWNGCSHNGCASYQVWRGRAARRWWCGKHEPRSLRYAQGRQRIFTQGGNFRHDDRLAVHQSLDEKQYGVDSMPETGENVAEDFAVSRQDQDAFALRSQEKRQPRRAMDALRRKSFRSRSHNARVIRLLSTRMNTHVRPAWKHSQSWVRPSVRVAP